MATLETDIDDIYRQPLSGFTAARNALAKGAGSRAAEIKSLEKPSVAAWAVNQLYWRERRTYDRLITAATRLRQAQAKQLSGRQSDVPPAETAHRDALKDAVAAAKEILGVAGEAASAATLTAVTETLRALPADHPPGRLTRPLKPLGFEALAGILRSSARIAAGAVIAFPAPPRVAPEVTSRRAREAAEAAQVARAEKLAAQEAERRKREAVKLTREVRTARSMDQRARTALERAEQAMTRAEEARDAARRQMLEASSALKRLEAALAALGRV
jgi:hypothetical protein